MRLRKLETLYEALVHSTTPTPDAPAANKLSDPEERKLVDALEAKIGVAKVALYDKAPYLGRIISKLKIKIVNSDSQEVQTMAVDNNNNIYINPAFSNKLTDPEFYGVFAHEAFHHANGTFFRKGNRNHKLWNIATDAQMNWALTRDGFKLPKEGIIPSPEGEWVIPDTGDVIKVVDAKGYPLSCEEIYDQLVKVVKNPPKDQKGGGKGQKQKSDSQGKPEKGEGEATEGSGWDEILEKLDNKTDKHLTDEEAKRVNKDVEEALTEEELKQLERERIADLRAGQEEEKRKGSATRGVGTGSIRGVIKKSIPVHVDWKGIIRRYLVGANSSAKTWLKPNIRGLAGGYSAPGKTQTNLKLDAIFALDTSGSIGDAQLQQAAGFAKQMAAAATNLNVRIVLWHSTAYYMSQPLTSKGALESTLTKIVTQSGGTYISSVAAMLQKNKITPKVTIYITDGYTEDNPAVPPGERLFVVVNSQALQDDSTKAKIEALYKGKGQIVFVPDLQ